MIIYSVIAVIVFSAFIYKERYQVGVDQMVVPVGLVISIFWPLSALALLIEYFSKALAKFFVEKVK